MQANKELRERIKAMQMSPSDRAHALQSFEAAEAIAGAIYTIVCWFRSDSATKASRPLKTQTAAH